MSDQIQVSIPVATIKVGGTDVGVAESDLDEIVIDTTYNLPAMASIRLYDHYLTWLDGDAFALGDTLSVAMAPPKMHEEIRPAEVFVGEIVALEPSLSARGTHTLTIRAYDLSHRLHIGTKSRTFLNMSESDIVSEIARELGLRTGIVDTLPKQKYIIQNNLTDYEFLAMRAKRVGCLFSVVANKLNFHKPEKMGTGPTLALGKDLRGISLRMSAARQAQKINVRGWDFRAKKEILGTNVPEVVWNENAIGKAGGAAAKTAFGFNGISTLTTLAPQTKDEADLIAKAASFDQEGDFTEADGVAFGDPKLVAGMQIELIEMGKKYSGKYYVTQATHIYNATGYEVHFTIAGRYPQTMNQLLNGTPVGAIESGTIHGVVVGIVTNVQDPENLGRVKVRFPWLADVSAKVESDWARIAAPMAGKARGFYFLPEVEDEVLVAFEHGNPNFPYIVGNLWNGKDAPPENNSVAHTGEGTIHRMLVTRSGHKVIFDDSNSKKSILIVDATGKQSMFFDSVNSMIEIKTNGDMKIGVTGNLDISVGGNMTVEARGKFKTTGQGGVEILTNSNMKLDAKMNLDMKGAMGVKLETPLQMAIDGATINMSSKGPLAVKGLPISLN